MSLPIDREFVTQAVVVLGACLGGWMVFVQPKAEELAKVEGVIATQVAQAATVDHATIELVANLAPKIRARCDEIDEQNRIATDSSLLYGRIMDVATREGIKIKNLRPTVDRAGAQAEKSITRIDVTGEGDFEHIAAFFAGLNEIGTPIRAVSVQLTPTKREGESSAVLQLGCEAVRFALPKSVDQFRKTSHDT